jgi:uridylate kinase
MPKKQLTILSLGGSLVVPPAGIDTAFLKAFVALLGRFAKRGHKFVIVTGGGSTARTYMAAASVVVPRAKADAYDRVGIAATRLNAALVRAALGTLADAEEPCCLADVRAPRRASVVMGGWKPGRSSDAVTVDLAIKLGADRLINLTDDGWIYDRNPKLPGAVALPQMTWAKFHERFPGPWHPGLHAPFDPVAAKAAAKAKLSVTMADARDLKNLARVLDGKPGRGTTIS